MMDEKGQVKGKKKQLFDHYNRNTFPLSAKFAMLWVPPQILDGIQSIIAEVVS